MRNIFLLISILSLISACKKGQLEQSASQSQFSEQSFAIVDYDATHLQILVKGQALADNVESFHQVQFFDNPGCVGDVLGSATASILDSTGAVLRVSHRESLNLYYRTNTNPDCYAAGSNRSVGVDPVPTPQLNRTSPESPSRNTTTIAILGNAFPSQAIVELYSDTLCTQKLTEGPAADFDQPGLLINIPSDAVTPVAAITRDPRGVKSDCELLINYEHRSGLSSSIEFITTIPLTPSNTSNEPTIFGRTDDTIVSVELFTDSACSNSLGTTNPDDFENTGLVVTLPAEQSSFVYARGLNVEGDLTGCLYMTQYLHDSIAPAAPTFTSESPSTPTRLTALPLIFGNGPSDAAIIRFYSDSLCTQVIGFGTVNDFSTVGITANLPVNSTTTIYATSMDAGGNESACTFMISYKHNTIPPQPPIFQTSSPTSPTNVNATPFIIGIPSTFTSELRFFDDIACTNQVGIGTPAEFASTGIQVTLQENTNNFVYTTVRDIEGNWSECTELTTYDHSNLPAPNPTFTNSFPTSPTRITTTPSLAGSAVDTITNVNLYLDSGCSTVSASGSRGNFMSSGLPITVNANAITPVYAMARDIYGNDSTCQHFTDFIHTVIPPMDPTYTAASPASPNNVSFTPTLTGTAFTNIASPIEPISVSFHDNPSCVGNLGSGTPADFNSTGIEINVAPNAPSTIYARSVDLAGNYSTCTYLTDYIHNTLPPGRPLLGSLSPGTPSYTPRTIAVGSYGPSIDFMARTSIVFYTDTECTNELLTGNPTQYEGAGIEIDLPENQITPLSAATFNGVGNKSDCSLLVNYNTYDTAPANLAVSTTQSGALRLNWSTDGVADPTPAYTLKRSLQPGGPYNTIYTGFATSTQDNNVTEGETYYYVVQASNSTGQSLNSAEVSFTVDAPAPIAAGSLTAYPGPGQATLTWSGFPQNMSYIVYRATQSGGPYTELEERPTGSSMSEYNLTNDTAYYYMVKGFNPEGQSQYSNEVRVVPRAVPAPPAKLWVTPSLSAPECSGNPGFILEWTAPSHYNEFRVQRNLQGGGTYNDIVGNTRWVHCNFGLDNRRTYSVTARWGPLESPSSPEVIFRPNDSLLTVNPGDGLIDIQWSADSAADTIEIFRSLSADGPFELYTTQPNTGSYIDTAVTNGVGYFYYVQAREMPNIIHGFPTTIQGGVPGPAPLAPTNLTAFIDEFGGANLSWSVPTHFNGFNVYRAASAGGPYSLIGQSTEASFVDSFPPDGMNYYQVTARWGTGETLVSNTLSIRRGRTQNLVATNNNTDVTLDWDAFPGVSDYRVERSESDQGPWTTIAFPATNIYADTTALSGVGYFYRVIPRFADATEGQVGDTVRGQRTDNLTPSGFALVTVQSTSISFAWNEVPGASNYVVEFSESPGGPFTNFATVVPPAINVSGLTVRTKYYFRVTANVGAGTHVSPLFEASTLTDVFAPSGIVGDGQIEVQWTASLGVDTYDLERSSDAVNFSTIASGLTSAIHIDTTAVNGNKYYYRVKHIYNSLGEVISDISNGYTPGTTPLPPQGLSVVRNDSGFGVYLSWTPSAGATFYSIQMSSTGAGGPYVPLFNISANTDVFVPGLTPGSTYHFRVASRNGENESAPSAVVAAIPNATPPAPTGAYVNSTELALTWSAFAGASSYDVQRSIDGQNYFVVASGVVGTTYNDTTVDPEVNYTYKYQPISAGGENLPISAPSLRLNSGVVINTPTGLTVEGNTTPEVTLRWAPVSQAQNYEIYRSNTSGSGFALVDTVAAPLDNWTDVSVVMGQTYFYQIRALNSSSVPSAYSSEVNISLQAGPTNLIASNNGSNIDLSWDSVAGASQYVILRSADSAGNFGIVGTSGTLNFSDSTVLADITYYYKVIAQFAGGENSLESNMVSLLKSGSINISFPVELIDRAIASTNSETRSFQRSQTQFNTNSYDGTVSYEFEIVASNVDVANRSVNLIDENDIILSSFTVNSGTTSATRFVQSFTPNVGAQTWRLQVEQTGSDQDVVVSQARVIVKQVNATKSSIYIPLLSSNGAATSEDLLGEVFATGGSSFVLADGSLPYVLETASMDKMLDINPWTLEMVVSAEPNAIGEIGLYNIDQDTLVNATLTEFEQANPTVVRVPVPANPADFDSDNESEAFGVAMRCQIGCELGEQGRVYKMGLWVHLENLSKAQLHWRTSKGYAVGTGLQHFEEQRFSYTAADFSNPQIYWQASMISNQSINLASAGTNDSGIGGSSDIVGSTLTGDGSGNENILRTGALSLSSGDRHIVKTNPGSGFSLTGSVLIINTQQ